MKMQTMIVPNHIALIPDGNRRWIKGRGGSEFEGYMAGGEKFSEVLDWCFEAGIRNLSAYVLSMENFRNRTKKELNYVIDAMCKFIVRWLRPGSVVDKHKVKVNFVGNLDKLPKKILKLIKKMDVKTKKYKKCVVNILIAYSGKDEIAKAFQNILTKFTSIKSKNITAKLIEKNMLVGKPVDLVIRTGGQNRLSNFLLWQTAYAEVYTTETLWPDLSKKEFLKSLNWFSNTQRNFGK